MMSGTTRNVKRIFNIYVIKFPTTRTWKLFLLGMLANIQEREWYSYGFMSEKLCPYFFTLFGLFLLGKYASPINEQQYSTMDTKSFEGLPLDNKMENFGTYKGRIVLVDYGS